MKKRKHNPMFLKRPKLISRICQVLEGKKDGIERKKTQKKVKMMKEGKE